MRHTYQTEQWLPYPVELVFAFFANPENLPRIMPKWQKARIEEARFAPPPPRPLAVDPALRFRSIAAGAGSGMTISFRPFPYSPLRVPWEASITDFMWNEYFCDEQQTGRGPFAYWRHCHRVQSQAQGGVSGTIVRDELEYEPPFGALGELAHGMVRHQIESIFAYRRQRVPEILSVMAAGFKAAAPPGASSV